MLQKFILQEISPTSALPSPFSWLMDISNAIRGLEMEIPPFKITRPNYLKEYFEGLTTYDEKVFNLIKPLLKGHYVVEGLLSTNGKGV
ncbi:hypothetical protein [Saccharolobus islandicus]|uniref:Uncharacterized protein n=1 Tax=Saccharolobus islandicus (strain L.D.8.5 / Lassen \|nr:hypothetical protein [Sulfolobus islandicus]ADB86558.1 hypothetical protein LD85_0844 [Sulfolobus islandicus L.D.8.5]